MWADYLTKIGEMPGKLIGPYMISALSRTITGTGHTSKPQAHNRL